MDIHGPLQTGGETRCPGGVSVNLQEQDKSSDIEQHSSFGDRKYSNTLPQNGGMQNQREHHIIEIRYEAVHQTYVSENISSSGMLIILTKKITVVNPK